MINKFKTFIVGYNFLICLVFTIAGALSAKTPIQLINSFIYLPLSFYFALLLLWKIRSMPITEKVPTKSELVVPKKKVDITDVSEIKDIPDADRRVFLRLIGSAGVAMFMMALFTKKAEAAFFGSVPGPGTISLKDSAGNKIDPAEKQPTDGYEISEIDDGGIPAYFGFVRKDGYWYIMRESPSGSYRYAKGTGNFSANWSGRTLLSYDYYNAVFT